jgi:hypothetical protein
MGHMMLASSSCQALLHLTVPNSVCAVSVCLTVGSCRKPLTATCLMMPAGGSPSLPCKQVEMLDQALDTIETLRARTETVKAFETQETPLRACPNQMVVPTGPKETASGPSELQSSFVSTSPQVLPLAITGRLSANKAAPETLLVDVEGPQVLSSAAGCTLSKKMSFPAYPSSKVGSFGGSVGCGSLGGSEASFGGQVRTLHRGVGGWGGGVSPLLGWVERPWSMTGWRHHGARLCTDSKEGKEGLLLWLVYRDTARDQTSHPASPIACHYCYCVGSLDV